MYKIIYFTFLGLISNFSLNSQTIEKLAGNGGDGFSGDYGLATNSYFSHPNDLAIDSYGQIFITDRWNNRIRKIDNNGIVTTIAGTGIQGNSGDGGFAFNAQISNPTGIVIDNNNNIYFVSNTKIRKIDANGMITTIAGNENAGYSGDGGLAVNAEIYPYDIAFDSNNNLIIGCLYYIRKIDTNGIITTIAGTGNNPTSGNGGLAVNASLRVAQSIFIDNFNNIYFSDAFDNIIRKIDSNGNISTIAGIGVAGFAGDNGPATGAQLHRPLGISKINNSIYFCDSDNLRIRKFEENGIISTYAGSNTFGCTNDGDLSSASFKHPFSIIYHNNSIYITDESCNNISKIEDDSLSNVEISPKNIIHIFPNPISESFKISNTKNATIKIFDLNGKLLKSILNYSETEYINAENISKGMYLVKVFQDSNNYNIKLIKN